MLAAVAFGAVCRSGWGAQSEDDPAWGGTSIVVAGTGLCGNGVVDAGEQCDGTDDAACLARCRIDCRCPSGPDVIVSNLYDFWSYGSAIDPRGSGEMIAAFAVGTKSCNIGDVSLQWIELTNEHPVIRQGLYRLKGGRFEQIGTSWVKHGFFATNDNDPIFCTASCVRPDDRYGGELRPGCSDPYSASLNGSWTYLGPSSQIDAYTGYFPFPYASVPASGNIAKRLQAFHRDLEASLNPGARYFVEGHYVTADDAAAGNATNNASYREIDVLAYGEPYPGGFGTCGTPLNPTPFCITGLGTIEQERPAIHAWKDLDATVRVTEAVVPSEGMYVLGAKVSDLGTGLWHYEYALYNLNSHRSAGSFSVQLPAGATVVNAGFHDVDYHSGEPWNGTDWPATLETDRIAWSTTPYANSETANALRWSTLYNFRFDTNVPPADGAVLVGLFRPGFPTTLGIRTRVPALEFLDCNHNGVPDHCDVSCDGLGCAPPDCGTFPDCNHNGIPDGPACEADCNGNGVPDRCDMDNCPEGDLTCGDCNGNTVPDGCEDDCDGDGIPNGCDVPDTDLDGIDDCDDLCPFTTPEGACLPPAMVRCCLSGSFEVELSWDTCASLGGIAVCGDPGLPCALQETCRSSECRSGCLVGDFDRDGDLDMADFASMQDCYSDSVGAPGYVATSAECLLRFDFDDDQDVDGADFVEFSGRFAGP